jgi:glycosyltransferase involved in cell wall biosynthesis
MSIGGDGMVDFVVRTRNERDYVRRAIGSIFSNFGHGTRVVVVDNMSTDGTMEAVQSLAESGTDIVVKMIENYKPGLAINMGLAECKSDFACILSAHCEVVEASTNSLISHFSDDSCFGVVGSQMPLSHNISVEPKPFWGNFTRSKVEKNPIELDDSCFLFHNAFSFISMKHWRNHKFDEFVSRREDRLWASQMIPRGLHFIFDPSCKAVHYYTANGATWK